MTSGDHVDVSVLFPKITVGGANALAGFGCVGYPALTAFLGFAHVLARLVAGADEGRFLRRFAIIHHSGTPRLYGTFHDRLTQKRAMHADQGGPSKTEHWHSPPDDTRPQIDLQFSLLIEASISKDRAARIEAEKGDLIVGPQALGGHVRDFRPPDVGYSSRDLLAKAPRGFVITDRTPDLFTNDGRDPLDVLLDHLESQKNRDRLFMAHIGYLGISPIANRKTGRSDQTLHRHVEPVFGMAEFRFKYGAADLPIFWTPFVDAAAGTYLVKGEYV